MSKLKMKHYSRNGADLPGTALARYMQYMANPHDAQAFLNSLPGRAWATTPQVKGAVDPYSTTSDSGSFALRSVWGEFVDFLAPLTIFDRVKVGGVRVPFRANVRVGEAFASGAIIDEGSPMPISSAAYSAVYLDQRKVGSLVVVDGSLVKFGSTASEQLLLGAVTRATVKAMDAAFIDPNVSGSLVENCRVQSSSGSTTAQILADLQAMASTMADDDCVGDLVWVMKPETAVTLAGKYTTAGTLAFPYVTVDGGSLLGIPVLVSRSSPQQIALVDRTQVVFADDERAEIAPSSYATLQMLDNPSSGATTNVSLWQNGMKAIMASRYVNWTLPHLDTTVSPHVQKGAVVMSISY